MERSRKIIRAGIVGIIVNLVLSITKMVIGSLTRSIAIINDGVNNLTDATASLCTIIGTKISTMKPSKKYPFGLGRVEYITAVLVSVIVLVVGLSSLEQSIVCICKHVECDNDLIDIIILLIALACKLALGIYFRIAAKTTDSKTLKSSAIDCLSDCVMSTGTVVATVIHMTTGVSVENYLAIIISLVIIKSGFDLTREAIEPIIGQREGTDIVRDIKKMVIAFLGVEGVDDVILHDYGLGRCYGSLSIEISGDTKASEIHELTRNVKYELFKKYGYIINIGVYAHNAADEKTDEIFDEIIKLCKRYPGIKQVHGFYINWESKTVFLDLDVDFIFDPQDIAGRVEKDLGELYPNLKMNIVAGRQYS